MNNTTNHKCVVAPLFPQPFSPQSRLFIINLETKKTLTLFWSSLILVVNSFLPDLGIFPPEPSQCEPMQRRSNTILSYCFFPFFFHYILQTQFTVSSLLQARGMSKLKHENTTEYQAVSLNVLFSSN